MNFSEIQDNIRNCEIVTDIYSGNYICKCGKRLGFTDLHLGGFGSSVACSCGNRFWITSDDEGTEELLVYEGYDFISEESFLVVKQKVYAGIDWSTLKLDEKRLREENEFIQLIFPNKADSEKKYDNKLIIGYENAEIAYDLEVDKQFFNDFNIEDMNNLSIKLEKYCECKGIAPNYGKLLSCLIRDYNVFDLVKILQSLVKDKYVELFIKEGLHYLFEPRFMFGKEIIESNLVIDSEKSTIYAMLGIPKKSVKYIRENKLSLKNIQLLQNFFQECSLRDFEILVCEKESIFELCDLDDLKRLLMEGCSSYKLNCYAKERMCEEGLSKSEFIMLLRDSLKMSKAAELEFKLYGKNLRQRHDELVRKYKLVRNDSLNKSLKKISEGIRIKQYGNRFTAIIPASVQDFELEAKNQKHCVMSYVEDMAAEETLILFIRYRDEITKSHITLEIKNRKVVQAKRFANGFIDEEDKSYLEKLCGQNGWYFYI